MAGEIIRRPDLEAQKVSYPDYVGTRIYPWLGKPQIAGRLYYQKYKSDITAQLNRDTAALGEITKNVIAANDIVFSVHEVRARVAMGYTQRIGYFDNEHADLAAGRLAKRAYFNELEKLTANKLFKAAGAVDGVSDPVGTIDTNVSLLRDCGIGRIALVGANRNLVALKNNQTIIERMKSTGVGTYDLKDIRNVGWAQLGAAFGVDEVLPMKDEIGYSGVTGANKDCVALVVLPDEYADPAEEIQLGRVVYFMFTDSEDDRVCMESWVDAFTDSNVVDAKGLVQLIELNAELRKTIRVFDDNSDSGSDSLSL